MLTALTNVILPVVLVAVLGAVLGRTFTLDQASLNKVQLYGLVPALAFSSLMKTTAPLGDIVHLGVAYALASLAIGVLAWLAGIGLPGASRGSVIASSVIGNNGNFGLPIALLALGQPGLDAAVLIFIFSLVVMWTVGPAALGSHGGLRGAALAVLRMPTIWAVLVAGGLRVTHLTPPAAILSAVDIAGAGAVPMVLLSLGIQLGRMGRLHLTRPVLTASILRVLVLPLLAWGVGLAVGLRGLPLQSLVLACAMPTAVNVMMIAMEYDADAEAVASTVALTTLASIATVALVVAYLPAFA